MNLTFFISTQGGNAIWEAAGRGSEMSNHMASTRDTVIMESLSPPPERISKVLPKIRPKDGQEIQKRAHSPTKDIFTFATAKILVASKHSSSPPPSVVIPDHHKSIRPKPKPALFVELILIYLIDVGLIITYSKVLEKHISASSEPSRRTTRHSTPTSTRVSQSSDPDELQVLVD